MNSLRWRLIMGVALACGLVLLIAGASLFVLIRKAMAAEFDRRLTVEAHVLMLKVEMTDGLPHVDIEPGSAAVFDRGQSGESFELWDGLGRVVQRSASLGEWHLPGPGAPSGQLPQDVGLPGGRHGRQVTIKGLAAAPVNSSGAVSADVFARACTLAVASDTQAQDATVAQARLALILVGSTTMVMVLAVVTLVVTAGLRPVKRLARAIGGIEAHNLTDPLSTGGVLLELRPIVDGLNQLLARLGVALTREKSLTAEVAHELRTPIYGLRTKLEIALSRPRTAEAYTQSLHACLTITMAMQAMVENLLTLARLDSGQFAPKPESLALLPFVAGIWEGFAGRAAERGFEVTLAGDDLAVSSDAALLQHVFSNLFENAVNHGKEAGAVEVRVYREGDGACVEVRNEGSRIAPEEARAVFKRFWRGDGARSEVGSHAGLGLALAERILQVLGHSISVETELNGWFCVRVRFASAVPTPAAASSGEPRR